MEPVLELARAQGQQGVVERESVPAAVLAILVEAQSESESVRALARLELELARARWALVIQALLQH